MKKNLLILLSFALFGLGKAQFSQPFVVMEEFTGAWCGFCPEGALIMDQLLANNQQAIGVAIHNGDQMENTIGTELANFYGPAYPQALANRDGSLYSRGQWASVANSKTQGASSVSVSIDSLSYDPGTRQVQATVKAFFTGPLSGDMRFNLIVTEREMTGNGTGWDQVNYSNNDSNSPLYQLGDPIPNYTHKHVMRNMLGGAWGTSGIISSPVNYGSTFTHTYTFTLASDIDENLVDLVAVVQTFGSTANERDILNGAELPLPPVVGIEGQISSDIAFMEVAPNPFSDMAKVVFTLKESGNVRMEVMNPLGQKVAEVLNGHMNQGGHSAYWNGRDRSGAPLESGVYLIRLVTESGHSLTKRVMLAH